MYLDNPCNSHPDKQAQIVCISKECPFNERVFCEECKDSHKEHSLMDINIFKKHYK